MSATEYHAEKAESPSILLRPFWAVGQFLMSIAENNARMREVDRLSALSDEQLAQKGLRREDIVRHVFRDMFFA